MTKSKCEPYKDKIIILINKEYGYREIARELNLDRNTVRDYCKKHLNYFSQVKRPQEPQTEEEVIKKITEYNPDVEYISGYKNYYSTLQVRFKSCGHYKKVTYTSSSTKNLVCLECAEKERKVIKEQKDKINQEKAAKREKQKLIKKFRNLLNKRIKMLTPENEIVCECCGSIFYTRRNKKYCSDKCANKVSNKTKDVGRRLKIKNALVDRNITVKRLYERDNGICAICHEKTEIEDYIVLDSGTIVCGNHYPSIDHIKPLSKGGLHSWSNVQLAHRICNTRKGDIYDQITMEN